ncbi:hypothetical protein IFM89_035975 [Coptis chinensis]|uniref:Uncharacterized protein n=1 Tax=Coptis chinensis TaxID=261450 RepID=A0A835LPN8_9MAGN|nr:hypothetical protein IFM89_035975 [Coptis chinensis]
MIQLEVMEKRFLPAAASYERGRLRATHDACAPPKCMKKASSNSDWTLRARGCYFESRVSGFPSKLNNERVAPSSKTQRVSISRGRTNRYKKFKTLSRSSNEWKTKRNSLQTSNFSKQTNTEKERKKPNEDATTTWDETNKRRFLRSKDVEVEKPFHLPIQDKVQSSKFQQLHILKSIIVDAGYTIPVGWAVMVCPPAIHLNPAKYEDPLVFNPWRWKVDH